MNTYDDLTPPEQDENEVPPIWHDHRAEPPGRPISHAFIWIDGEKAGRLNRPSVLEIDDEFLARRYPQLDDGRSHEVRIDFRAASGRGALAQIRFTYNEQDDDGSLSYDAPPAPAHSETSVIAAMLGRLLRQNETLIERTISATTEQAKTNLSAFDSMGKMMLMSMERDRERHAQHMERIQSQTQFYSERQDRLLHSKEQEQKELYAMLMSKQENAAAAAQAAATPAGNPLMEGIQAHITERVMGALMEKFDDVLSGNAGAPSPAAAILGALGPVLADKLSGGDEAPDPGVQMPKN